MKPIHAKLKCHRCYQGDLCIRLINELENNIQPASEYNRYLFLLYLQYVRRLKTQKTVLSKQARQFAAILEKECIPELHSWAAVRSLSKRDRLGTSLHPTSGNRNCCPWLRVGYMLQEIGVLSASQDERGIPIRNYLASFDQKTVTVLENYIAMLKKRGSLNSSLVLRLSNLRLAQRFLEKKFQSGRLLLMTPKLFDEFVEQERSRLKNPLSLRPKIYHLLHFYRWAKLERLILKVPCDDVALARRPAKITVCSEAQLRQLRSWIKNPSSEPRYAMVIALTLFFGLTARDILTSQIEIKDDQMVLRIKQSIAGQPRRVFRTEAMLVLPREPRWFFSLQKRFYKSWQNQYRQLRVTNALPWLVLSVNMRTNNPATIRTIHRWMHKATLEATGKNIPIRYIRQSCGHIYSTNSDAAILSRFGWAPSTAFSYVWTPRVLYT